MKPPKSGSRAQALSPLSPHPVCAACRHWVPQQGCRRSNCAHTAPKPATRFELGFFRQAALSVA
ncbi:MAG: hypothetical protein HZA31_08190 [Opitutae bacterium]|nr:hypothetical protein [Opitutae bacterium]